MQDKITKNKNADRWNIVMTLLILNLMHKIAREIPGSFQAVEKIGRSGIFFTIGMAIVVMVAIILLLFRKKAGVITGLIPASWLMLQWIFIHVIKGMPDPNGIWWNPILPITLGACYWLFALKLIKSLTINQKKESQDE